MGFRDLVKNMLRPNAAPKVSGAPRAKVSAAGPVIAFSSIGQPKWTPRRYEALAEEGFRKNVIAYRCVMQIATACSAVPWLLYDDEGSEIDQHPLLDLLRHPNPLQDGVTFLESVYAYLEIAGNAYIEAVKSSDSGAPVELYVLRPDRMKVVPGPTGLPMGYQYSVNGQITSWPADPLTGASNILHLRRFHPLDDWYGMAPMEGAALSIDQHNAAGAWNQALLNHGARPSGALVYAPKDGPSTLTDDQLRRLREEMGQLYEGSRNAGRPLILEGGLDWREMSLSPKDMDWMAGRTAASRDIALAFGVPAQLVGVPDAQTYSNMAEARMAFYEETVLPLLTRVIASVDHWLTPMFDEGLELDYDPDDISALAVRRDAQWTKLQNASFLSINEKREAAGYECVPGGDAVAGIVTPVTNEGTQDGVEFTYPLPYHDPETGRFTSVSDETESGDNDNDQQPPLA
jgi:HK97 family phage portal protein